METKQTKEEKATIDIVKEMQKTVNTLGSTIGELKGKVDAMPTDYVKSDEIGKVMNEYFKEARIYSSTVTAKIPESLTETINGLMKSFGEAKTGIDESIASIKPRKPLLSVSIGNRLLLILTATVLLSVSIGLLVFINSPEHLATALYELSSEMDEANPGSIYHDAYTKARNKRRKEIKAEIKAKQLESVTNKETSTILEQYLEEPVIVRKIIYGSHNDKLVMFRIVGKDIYWRVYFSENGYVLMTESSEITTPQEAEAKMTSPKVRWMKLE